MVFAAPQSGRRRWSPARCPASAPGTLPSPGSGSERVDMTLRDASDQQLYLLLAGRRPYRSGVTREVSRRHEQSRVELLDLPPWVQRGAREHTRGPFGCRERGCLARGGGAEQLPGASGASLPPSEAERGAESFPRGSRAATLRPRAHGWRARPLAEGLELGPLDGWMHPLDEAPGGIRNSSPGSASRPTILASRVSRSATSCGRSTTVV